MTQPPDDRRPMPWDPPETPETPAGEQPTVAWTPPPVPDADAAAWAPATGPADASPPPPADPGATSAPPPDTAPVPPAWTTAPAQNPLISSTPSPAVAWAAPDAGRPEVAPGLVFSGTGARLVAYVVDLIIVGIATSIVAGAVGAGGATSTAVTGAEFDLSSTVVTPLFAVISTAISAAYFILSWSGGRRATLGQRMFDIQVGNAFDGQPLTTEQAVRRWLGLGTFLGALAVVPVLGGISSLAQFLWVIALLITTASSPTRQGLHDRFANSAVVRPRDAGNGLVVACLVIVIVIFALGVLSIVALVLLGTQVSSILSEVGESIQP